MILGHVPYVGVVARRVVLHCPEVRSVLGLAVGAALGARFVTLIEAIGSAALIGDSGKGLEMNNLFIGVFWLA